MSNEDYAGVTLRSTISSRGKLRLALENESAGKPGSDEVVIRVEAAPVNPSDMGLLLGAVDLATAERPDDCQPMLSASVSAEKLDLMRGRFDQPMRVGGEGAGTVVAAGQDVRDLIGRKVGFAGQGSYSQYRRVPATDCLVLPQGLDASQGASWFVNPLTALTMLDTMRREGHRALIHTAAASNLGQMLVKICRADGVNLVNVVRNATQADILRNLGAEHIVISSAPDFRARLVEAIAATDATLAFDAIGGGRLANDLLHAMEVAASRTLPAYSRYGSPRLKQVYVYGGLDTSLTEVDRSYGMAWSIGGYLVTWALERAGPQASGEMRARVSRELTTTFASTYTGTIGLKDLLDPDVLRALTKKATGEKYLVDPQR